MQNLNLTILYMNIPKIIVCVDADKIRSVNHSHHIKDGWNTLYYYKNGRKRPAKICDKDPHKECKIQNCSSFNCFRGDTFYKVQALSKNDNLFDYYKIKKKGLKNHDTFAKQSAKQGKKGRFENNCLSPNITIRKGEFVLHF